MAKSTSSSALLSSMRFSMDFSGLRLSHIVPQRSGSTSVRSCLPNRALRFASRSSRCCLRALAWEWTILSFPSSVSCAPIFVSFFDAIGSLWTFPGAFFCPSGCSEPLLPGEPQGHFSPWSVPSLVFIFACGRCWTSPRRRCFPSTPPSLTM